MSREPERSPSAWPWLLLALALTPLAAYRVSAPLVAWVAPAPWLIFAARTQGWRARGLLLGALILASSLQVAKIVTPPVPMAMAPAFGLPAALTGFALVLVWVQARRRAGPLAAILCFGALAALGDVATWSLSELGSWGTQIASQVRSPLVLQWSAWLGPGLVSALAGATAATLAGLALGDRVGRAGAGLAAITAGLLVAGSARMDGPTPGRPLRVGLVSTDRGPGPEGLPAAQERAKDLDRLFARTDEAAAQGAALIAWNEAAAMLDPADEAAFMVRASSAARRLEVDLVVGYGVLISASPMRYRNEAAWFSPEGELLQVYAKHHPVPGEPSERGTAPLALVETAWGRAGIAICYDYDFPALAREYAQLGADLVVVPSSDWAGIDPQHAEMAAARAVESGVPVVRPVRWSTSAAFDAHGRARGWLPPEEGLVRVLEMPVGRVPTLYARVGDLPVVLAALLTLMGVGWAAARGPR